MNLTDIPSALDAPASPRRSAVRKAMIHHVFGRRSLLRAAFAGGVAIGLTALDLLPTGPKASAVPATWRHCQAYSDWDNGWWNICNPCAIGHPPRDIIYCKDGYHRTDTEHVATGILRHYFRRHQSCMNKNAWVWHISDNRTTPNPRDRRCSDGRFRTVRVSDGEVLGKGPTVCMKMLRPTGEVHDDRPDPRPC